MEIHKTPGSGQEYAVFARIDRLPSSRYLMGLIARIAAGGWFEFFELFMPGFISLGLVRSGIFTLTNKGLLDTHSFASFLASFFLGMFLSTCLFGFVSDRFGRRSVFIWSMVVYSAAQFMVAVLSDATWIDLARLNESTGALGAAQKAYEACLALAPQGVALHNEAALGLHALKRRLN